MYVLYITVLFLMYASDCVLSTSVAIPDEFNFIFLNFSSHFRAGGTWHGRSRFSCALAVKLVDLLRCPLWFSHP